MEELVDRIRGIRVPEPDFWWPPAPGWWLLGGLLLLLLLSVAGYLYRRSRLRRRALAELRRIHHRYLQEGDGRRLAMALNLLLRRVALAKRPRAEVAPLRGEAWLAFLDRLGRTREFTRGAGRALLQAPYDPKADVQPEALLQLAREWLKVAA